MESNSNLTEDPGPVSVPGACPWPGSGSWVEREAKLFEAGDFPDKGITLRNEDLAELARQFHRPVPIWIEHGQSPLEVGYLTQVRAVGSELFGTVALTAEADALIERSGARSLSLGLSQDLREIREVSLVRHPRIPDARLFFVSELATQGQKPIAQATDARAGLIQRWLREGRLVPAQLPSIRALAALDSASFSAADGSQIWDQVQSLIQNATPQVVFQQLAPAALPELQADAHLLLPEEAAFYRQYFPDLDLAQIAQRRWA